MLIVRNFAHKAHGAIGSVNLEVADDFAIRLDGVTIPTASVEYLLTFALQSLQDAYAGAEDSAEAQGNFAKRLARIIAGEMGTRESGGAGVDPRDAVMVSIVKPLILRNMDKAGKKSFNSIKPKEQLAAVADFMAQQTAAWNKTVDEAIGEEIAAQAARQKRLSGLSLDI